MRPVNSSVGLLSLTSVLEVVLKQLTLNSGAGKIAVGALIGALAGAVILFFFGDGFAMAFYLAGEGVVFGGFLGTVIGLLVFLASCRSRKPT